MKYYPTQRRFLTTGGAATLRKELLAQNQVLKAENSGPRKMAQILSLLGVRKMEIKDGYYPAYNDEKGNIRFFYNQQIGPPKNIERKLT